ncbi:MAG: carbohydrate kinase, partial [Rhodobacteraceae bacterium]|nr:carbohydrate kinase [Paracoccaceae bacterium]
DLPARVRALFFGGISLPVEPCGATYEVLMLQEAPRRVTMLDPNIRPGFISDEGAYRARLARMMAVADIVKLSDEDLRWLEGDKPIDAAAKGVLARGPRLVFVTEGARGAHGFSARHAVFAPAQAVKVVDTVGAGDTFNAGVLNALDHAGALDKRALEAADDALIRRALERGIAAAAVTVARAGANPPWAEDLA